MLDPYTIQHVLELQHLSIVGDVFSLKLLATPLGMSIFWGQQPSRNNNNNNQCGNAMKNTLTKQLTCLKDRHLVQSF